MFARGTRAEAHENRHKPNRIDRDKDRNEGKKELLDHGIISCVFALPDKPSTQCSLSSSIKPFQMKPLCLSLTLTLVADLSAVESKSVDDFRDAAAKAN